MNNKNIKSKKGINLRVFLWTFLFFLGFFTANHAEAATLYFSPSSGNYTVGNIFTVHVLVNTEGVAINNAEATINFPPNFLEIVSLSKSGSIFSLWVEEPTFSNSAGTLSFNGGLPTPGYNNSAGKILSAVFRVKKAGSASLVFSSAAVRANDGYGTNVYKSGVSALFNLVTEEKPSPPEEVPPTPPPVVGAPAAPKISSPSHPNPEKWYSNNDPLFTWEVPPDITGTRLLFGRLPTAVPTVFYPEAISEKQLEDLADGTWYFHVQLRNSAGWGEVSHFKLQIDTQPPEPFKIEPKEGRQTTNPQPTLFFETTDEISGIDHYEIIIDNKEPIKTEKSEYKIPPQDLGKHTIIVKAVDRAGNETLSMTEINILPIESPVISDYPKELLPGSILSIKGTAVPETTIIISIQKDKEEIKLGETKSDKEGKWVFIEVEPVEKGVYQVWAEAIDSSGARSRPSEKVSILVSPPVFIRVGKLVIDYLTTIMTLLILILAIIFGVFWAWLKIREKKKRMRKEISEAEKALHKAFEALRAEIKKQVAKLDGKPDLTKREEKIYNSLKKALKNSEDFIDKEMKDIEKEVK